MENKLKEFEDIVRELIPDLMFYDRKHSDFTGKDLDELIKNGKLSKEMIIQWFSDELTKNWGE